MGREREDFLKKIEEDKGNGYYFRNLLTRLGLLELEVSKTRNGNFRPSLLPEKYKRSSDDFDEFLFSLISAGYSPNQISRALKRLNYSYTDTEIERIKERVIEKVEDFKTRQLKEDWFCREFISKSKVSVMLYSFDKECQKEYGKRRLQEV